MSKLSLSKFDVAERQLFQAITLFFRDEDPVSIHTLIEAATQVLRDIGRPLGIRTALRDSDLIRENRRAEWERELSKSRNYFKHADRDAEESHEFDPVVNDFAIFDAITVYEQLKKSWTPETATYFSWFVVAHPNLIEEDAKMVEFFRRSEVEGALPDPNNKSLMYECIKEMRAGTLPTSHVEVKYGL